MKEVQKKLFDYLQSNTYFYYLLKIDAVIAVIYPIYLVLIRLAFLDPVWRYVGMVSAVLQILYYIGTILCFAENKLIPLDIAFGCMVLNNLFNLQYGISFNRLVYLVFYVLIVVLCVISTKNSGQWNEMDTMFYSKISATSESTIHSSNNAVCFCPNCGSKIEKGMNFCNNCGHQIM